MKNQETYQIKIHEDLKINGKSYKTKDDLLELALCYLREGKNNKQYLIDIANFIMDWIKEDPYIKVTTSGTTGEPKEIYLKKENMENSADITGKFFNLLPEDRALLCLTTNFIAGKMMFVRALVLGLHLDIVRPSSNPFSEFIKNESYDFVSMIPIQVEKSMHKLKDIKNLLIGGSSISRELEQSIQETLRDTGNSVYSTYGMTETLSHIAVRQITPSYQKNYHALPHTSFEEDFRGCLRIFNMKISDKPIQTNDMVKIVSWREFEWKGRADNVINSGGFKIFPESTENKLSQHIKDKFFIYSFPDERLGEKAVLIIEGEENNYQNLLETLKEDKNFSKFEIPKQVFFSKKFELTPTGKIQRKETIKKMF